MAEARNDVLEAVVSNYTDDYGLDPSMKENVASESEQEAEDVDSDAELQLALESGLLKPGLNVELPDVDETIYDQETMKTFTDTLREQNMEWLERMDVTCEPLDSSECVQNDDLLEAIQSNNLVNDDFKRELVFFGQAQAAIAIAIPKLHKLGVKTERPGDYFAEMAKSDEHMKKVRERLLAKSKTAERVEKIRKLREAKKFAKKVQLEKEKSKLSEKRSMNEKVDQVRRGKSKDLTFLNEDALTGNKTLDLTDKVVTKALMKSVNSNKQSSFKQDVKKKRNKLREAKDLKYGHGGKKRNIKRNDKKSFTAFGSSSRTDKKKSTHGGGGRGGGGSSSKSGAKSKQSSGGRGPKGKSKRNNKR